jgi:hypothetical protein
MNLLPHRLVEPARCAVLIGEMIREVREFVGAPLKGARTLSLAATIALTAGCASHPPVVTVAPVPAGNPELEVERYLPLQDGTVFSYDTHSEANNASGVLIVQISRPRQGRVDLRMGSRTERLQLDAYGVAYVEGGYLLRPPFATGSNWKGRSGTVRVANADESIAVPAGKFDGCLRTVEESQETGLSRTVTSVYCPHVGLVSVDVEGETGEQHDRETAVLRSFGPRVDIAPSDVTTSSSAD